LNGHDDFVSATIIAITATSGTVIPKILEAQEKSE
jgi:hypothetical protein